MSFTIVEFMRIYDTKNRAIEASVVPSPPPDQFETDSDLKRVPKVYAFECVHAGTYHYKSAPQLNRQSFINEINAMKQVMMIPVVTFGAGTLTKHQTTRR